MHIIFKILIGAAVGGTLLGLLLYAMLRRERRMKETDEQVLKYKEHIATRDALSKIAPDILAGFREKVSEIDKAAGKATRTIERSDGRWTLAYRAHERQETIALTHLGTNAVLVAVFYGGTFKGFGDQKHITGTAKPNAVTAPLVQELAEEFRGVFARDLAAG